MEVPYFAPSVPNRDFESESLSVSIQRVPPCLAGDRALLSVLLRASLGAADGPCDGIFRAGASPALDG